MRRAIARIAGLGGLTAAAMARAVDPAVGDMSQDALRTVGPHASHILDLWRLTLMV